MLLCNQNMYVKRIYIFFWLVIVKFILINNLYYFITYPSSNKNYLNLKLT